MVLAQEVRLNIHSHPHKVSGFSTTRDELHHGQHVDLPRKQLHEDVFVNAFNLENHALDSYIRSLSELDKRNLHEAATLHMRNQRDRSLSECHHIVNIFRLTSESILRSTVDLLSSTNVGLTMTQAVLSAVEYPLRVFEVPDRAHDSWGRKWIEEFYGDLYRLMVFKAQKDWVNSYAQEEKLRSGPNALQSLAMLSDFDRNVYQQIVMNITPHMIARLVGVSEEKLMSDVAYKVIVAQAEALLPAISNPFTNWHVREREKKMRHNPYFMNPGYVKP